MDWPSVAGFATGLILVLLLQWPVMWLLLKAVSTEDPKDGKHYHIWSVLRKRHPGNGGGRLIGQLEVTLFFVGLYFMPNDAHLAIGAYLAFKVASKWEVWSHVVRVPDRLKSIDDDVEYFAFRTRWGQEVFNRFIVGTLANVLITVAGIYVASLVSQRVMRLVIVGD